MTKCVSNNYSSISLPIGKSPDDGRDASCRQSSTPARSDHVRVNAASKGARLEHIGSDIPGTPKDGPVRVCYFAAWAEN